MKKATVWTLNHKGLGIVIRRWGYTVHDNPSGIQDMIERSAQ